MATVQESREETGIVYSLEGTLIEACSCNVNCPCWIGEDPDLGSCYAIVAYGIERGQIRDVDVSGSTSSSAATSPATSSRATGRSRRSSTSEGTEEQRNAMLDAFTGKLGGPLGDLWEALIGEVKGGWCRVRPISHQVEGGSGKLHIRGSSRPRWSPTGARMGP